MPFATTCRRSEWTPLGERDARCASIDQRAAPWEVGEPLNASIMQAIRRQMVLDCCKWDPQVGDVRTLAPFALVLQAREWEQLAAWAGALTREALSAEEELLESPALLKMLGLPGRLRRAFTRLGKRASRMEWGRVFRFDFHWTTEGWQISESNSDVPGGYCESSDFARLMANHYPRASMAGDPGRAWIAAIARSVPAGGYAALLSAAGYMEDQQVVSYLAKRLVDAGVDCSIARPHELRWLKGVAWLRGRRVDVIVRFYQGEWIASLPASWGWKHLVNAHATAILNPMSAMLTESKRFPLTWPALNADLTTWRRLLPATREIHQVDLASGQWLLKQAVCNTGDAVVAPELLPAEAWRKVWREARRNPRQWLAQRRFVPVAAQTPFGPMYPCIGVYTVDGMPAGIYGRLSRRSVVDYAAMDVAVLVERDDGQASFI